MKAVTVRRTTVNGQHRVTYNDEELLQRALHEMYANQGELYYAEFGVCAEDAEEAGWHPKDKGFDECCEGWKLFLADKGKITKIAETDTVGVYDLLQDEMAKAEEAAAE